MNNLLPKLEHVNKSKYRFFFFRLTGVEGDLLRAQVSLTLDRKHLDWVEAARHQTDQVKGHGSQLLHERHASLDLQPVVADVSKPRKPGEGGTGGGQVTYIDLAKETIWE